MKEITKILEAIEMGADFITFWHTEEGLIPAMAGNIKEKTDENKKEGEVHQPACG